MASKAHPTPEELRQLLRYEPETGKLFWKQRDVSLFEDRGNGAAANAASWNARYAGAEALTALNAAGYRHGAVFGCKLRAHRVAWALVHGQWPQGEIDHINGITDDNRLENLREVTGQENQRNSKRPANNTSGVVGVSWYEPARKWVARIRVIKRIHLGYFDDFNEAVAARKAAEAAYGFHQNHGRF